MIQFMIGVLIGGIGGFLIFAVLSANSSEIDEGQATSVTKEIGEHDARNQ